MAAAGPGASAGGGAPHVAPASRRCRGGAPVEFRGPAFQPAVSLGSFPARASSARAATPPVCRSARSVVSLAGARRRLGRGSRRGRPGARGAIPAGFARPESRVSRATRPARRSREIHRLGRAQSPRRGHTREWPQIRSASPLAPKYFQGPTAKIPGYTAGKNGPFGPSTAAPADWPLACTAQIAPASAKTRHYLPWRSPVKDFAAHAGRSAILSYGPPTVALNGSSPVRLPSVAGRVPSRRVSFGPRCGADLTVSTRNRTVYAVILFGAPYARPISNLTEGHSWARVSHPPHGVHGELRLDRSPAVLPLSRLSATGTMLCAWEVSLMRREAILSLSLLLLAAAGAAAQEWAEKMFVTTAHDFGSVARGSKAEFLFNFRNVYVEDVHVASVRSSCGCTIPRVDVADVKTYGESAVIATFNTQAFRGQRAPRSPSPSTSPSTPRSNST